MGSVAFHPLNVIASMLWATGTAFARKFSGERKRLRVRVISVGNIQVGGAGKTPLVACLARQAHDRGLQVCILTRGYGAKWEREGGVIAPEQRSPDPSECGDEALLLHELAPNAWIAVGADRAKQFEVAAAALREEFNGQFDLAILDDGFQNHRLHKDLDLVALTSASWGQKIFRDFRGSLRSADLLVWTKGEERPSTFGRPMVRVLMEIPPIETSKSGSQNKYLLVTGLADGGHAKKSAERAGYRIEKHLTFPDHARYAPAVMESILEEAKAAGLRIAMTGKDWVKWRTYADSRLKGSMIEVLEPTVQLDPSDEKIWNQVIWES